MQDFNMVYDQAFHSIDYSDKVFLITGGAGFIGSNLVSYLLQHGAREVRVLDNFSTGYRHNLEPFFNHPSFKLLEGDIRDLATCQQAVAGAHYVAHQAALGSVPRSINDPLTSNAVNISGFLNMLQAAKDSGTVVRFVYAASSSTYGDHPALPKKEDIIGKPLSPYAVTKYVNELYAEVFSRVYGFHSIGLRYFNVFGPNQNPNGAYAAVIPKFINAAIARQQPVIHGDGTQTRDFTFVSNVVQANVKSFEVAGLNCSEVVNVACGSYTSLNELWAMITQLEQLELAPQYSGVRAGDIARSLADVSKGKALLGYEPLVQMAEGLRITHQWYRQVHETAGHQG